jgi:daunorubicin resistance ABC transporter ATP-binding subunit
VARDLKKSYDGFEAVKGVDFDVHRGECFGFLGPNGAGKTTTMKMIYGAVIPTGGELDVAGLDVRSSEREIKRRIGVVPQENNLDDDLKVKENLLVYGRYYDLPRKVALQRAEELLEFVELTEKAESQVDQLSGGMKRRLLIARALINDPEIVVLDEPTTGLDPQARHLVWDRLRALTLEGKTLVLTTHYMEEAEELCDRVAIMDRGRVLISDTPLALVRSLNMDATIFVSVETEPGEHLDADLDLLPGVTGKERTGKDLRLRTEDTQTTIIGLMKLAAERGMRLRNLSVRSANLEDVFITYTGRELREQ